MDNAQHKAIKAIVDSYKDHYTVPVSDSKCFGRLMAGYTDSGRFYLEAAGEALEDWNWHREAALVRRMADGSVDVNAALGANELLMIAKDFFKMHSEGMFICGEDDQKQVDRSMIVLAQILNNVTGGNADWKFWSPKIEDRLI